LRFYCSYVRLLWVFKFFFGFLLARRSAWNHALHTFHSALGESETPFFGILRKEKPRKKAGKSAILRRSEELGACRVVNTAGRPS